MNSLAPLLNSINVYHSMHFSLVFNSFPTPSFVVTMTSLAINKCAHLSAFIICARHHMLKDRVMLDSDPFICPRLFYPP